MNNKLYVYTGLFFLAMLIMLLIFENSTVPRREPEKEGRTSKTAGRNVTAQLKKVVEFLYPGSAVALWTEHEDNLILLDEASQKFSTYSKEGRRLNSFGSVGPAPWENARIRHIDAEEDEYYVVDNQLMTVKCASYTGKTIYYRKLDEMIWDGIHLDDDRFLVLNDDPGRLGMQVIQARHDSTGEVQLLRDMVTEKKEDPNLNIVYEGRLIRGVQTHFYVCARAGLFMAFDKKGNYMYTGHTIDNSPPPTVTERTSGNVTYFVRDPDAAINYASTADRDYLYILSLVAFGKSSELAVDAYHVEDGSYSHSFMVPNHGDDLPVEILAGKDHFYVTYEDMTIATFDLTEK